MLELHNVVRSFNIPAKQELLDGILMRMQRNGNGQVDYKQYIDAINWRDHPGTFTVSHDLLSIVILQHCVECLHSLCVMLLRQLNLDKFYTC